MPFKFLPHTADVKIQAEGKSLEEAFKQSALAVKEVMSSKIKIKAKIRKEIKVEGEDKESLLYEFLEEFLYLFDAESFIMNKVTKIKITKSKNKLILTAQAIGDNSSSYKFTNDVKAITYNEMSIKENKGKVAIVFVIDV
jgi:SHS2 domain-containing protein